MEQCTIDARVFNMIVNRNIELIIAVDVDDTVIAGSNKTS